MDQQALQDALNTVVSVELEKYQCINGTLHCETRQSGDLLTLHGTKADGKPVLLWPESKPLRSLAGHYLDTIPNAGGFTLDIDLEAQTFHYQSISPAEIHARDKKEAKEREEAAVREKLDTKMNFQIRATPFGRDLAEQVAHKLQTRALYYTHRDYCGMGLELRDGTYCYGEVYDGGLDPMLRFENSAGFIDWLSKQSDASLGRLDEVNSWYWGNQTLTRERLESF
jgi:hypothetical protein